MFYGMTLLYINEKDGFSGAGGAAPGGGSMLEVGMKQKWFCEACNQGGEVDGDGDVMSVIHAIEVDHHAVSPDCEASREEIRVEAGTHFSPHIKKGDLVKNIGEELGIVVACGPGDNCVVIWGDGLHLEGPKADLEPVPFSPGAGITACFIEMANRCYPDHMTWLREGSPGSGRFA